MRYQIRLLDQNLPGLTREIAQACWRAADGIVREKLPRHLYRDFYRTTRQVLARHVLAFRYCNAAAVCERSIPRSLIQAEPRHEQFAGERVHVYLMDPEAAPALVLREIVQRAVKDVVRNSPRQSLPGLAPAIRNSLTKVLDQRIFASDRCGDDPLCRANEAYDPWDLRDPINRVRPTI